MKNKNKQKTLRNLGLSAAAIIEIFCAVCLALNVKGLNITPWGNEYIWRSPSYVAAREDELLVVDSNKRAVSLIDKDGNIKTQILGESGDRSFSNTNYITDDREYIYIADIEYASSGTRVADESIKKFDRAGNYVETVYRRKYQNNKKSMPAQNGFIRWMSRYEDQIFFIYYDNLILSINEITADGVTEKRIMYCTVVPDIWNISYSAYDDTVWIASKTGKLYYQTGNVKEFKLFNTDFAKSGTVFTDVSAYGENVYAVDVVSHQVYNIISGEAVIACEDPLEGMFINRVSAYEGGVAVTDGERIILASDNEGIIYSSDTARYSKAIFDGSLPTWICLAILILSGAALLILLLVYTLKNSRSKYTGTAFVVTLSVIISTVIISGMILADMFTRIEKNSTDSLVRTITVISESSSVNGVGDAVEAIKTADDYNSPEYLFVRQYLDAFCDAAYDSGSNMYYTVQRFDENFFYGIIDYENTIGTVYPSDHFEGSFYGEIVKSGEISVLSNQADEFGVWSFATAPIKNSSGETVAVVELGINMLTEQQQNTDIILSVVVKIAVVILLIILLLIEATVFADGISGFKRERDPNIPYFLRPMIFLTFFASNLSAAFIPQMSQEIFERSDMGYAGSVTSALPMSLQLFSTAIAALLCGKLLERFSMKPIMLTACVIQIAGYAVIAVGAFLDQYIMFSLGHFISGLGIGITVVAFNTMPDRVKDEELRTSYYSHLNAGVISGVVIGLSIGSYLADAFGHSATFIFSGIIVLFIGIIIFISVGKGKAGEAADTAPHISDKSEDDNFADKIGFGKFIGSADVWSFVICVMVPLLIMMYFKDYLFPMYGSSNGMSDVSIGNILLFAGAVSIVFGTVIGDMLFKFIGSFGMITMSSLITAACLVLFGLFPSVQSAVIVVFILSLSAGFGLAGQEVYYSSLDSFKKYGTKRAMSIYSIFDNASQTAAPLLMGALLMLGYGGECLIMGGAGIALYLIFLLIKAVSKKNGGKNLITYLETNENDIDEIELLYRKHLDNGTALRARLERVCRDPETLSLKAVDSETGKIVGVIMYTPGISFSCSYPRIVKKVENLAGNIPVYTGEAIFVEDEYRNRHIARNFEIKIREKIANIAKAKGTNIYVLHEMWVYPNGKTPAYGLVSTVFNICHDFGVIPRFYRDYFKNGSLCPICGENCVCSARITISEIGSETDPVN